MIPTLQSMANSQMLRAKSFKFLVVISVLWFLSTSFLIDLYRDCMEKREKCTTEFEYDDLNDITFAPINNSSSTIYLEQYDKRQLRRWKSPPVAKPAIGHPGEGGVPVEVPAELKENEKKSFNTHQFNLVASNLLSPNRSLLDNRDVDCLKVQYPKMLPTTSIIIVFHNEAWSTLTRTIWSVINTSPRALLREIILVDDSSELDYLGVNLERFTHNLPVPTVIVRTGQRSGLVNARIKGAQKARGAVLTFLDAHCECNVGWLEPLLARIVYHRYTVAGPVVDSIDLRSFEYMKVPLMYGGFNWDMNFRWFKLPVSRQVDPIKTPAMVGGLFAMDREYFFRLGTYDEQMKIWGSENLEMSFRVWQCGGVIEMVPCSRVGHVFRLVTPHSFPDGLEKTIWTNKARTVDVWMDEWAEFFYEINPFTRVYRTNVDERIALRKRLQCRSFRWYLENIYPETHFPFRYYYLGAIRNEETNTCFERKEKFLKALPCVNNEETSNYKQTFLYKKTNEIIERDSCVSTSANYMVTFIRCALDTSQFWTYNKMNQSFKDNYGQCLTKRNDTVNAEPCNGDSTQKWIMNLPFKWQYLRDNDKY